MTLDEFIAEEWKWIPKSSTVTHPDFDVLYVRKGFVSLLQPDHNLQWVNAITIARIQSKRPGRGAFTKLTEDLVQRGYVIYVENAHNPRFQNLLLKLGYVRVNESRGPNFIINHEGKVKDNYECV